MLGITTLLTATVQAGTVKVYAAASLSNALTDISKLYQTQYPQTKVVPVFAASSALAKQIEAGATSDIYFSADFDWMDYLVKKKKINRMQVQPFLLNQLVVVSPIQMNIPFQAKPQFNFAGSFQGHLCTGQMESVPAGKYAKQSLIKLGWLDDLKGRIVGTDDVRATLAFVERGECSVGIVYKTDALISQKVKIIGTFSANTHQPIIYPMALTLQGMSNKEAIQFERYVRTNSKAKQVFQRYGFVLKQ
ncbi:molybdate ABC transporter substrate-binding protein [Acinetobacter sp. A7.4]|nr:molybdate ABC transporter substrate-binding protein [Acinetobacter sp. A7.4]MCJ8161188.1 molybdate ABC transporter substrate-binding protein [Acinetobacter sp. A7.4]